MSDKRDSFEALHQIEYEGDADRAYYSEKPITPFDDSYLFSDENRKRWADGHCSRTGVLCGFVNSGITDYCDGCPWLRHRR